jgi:putative acetyltransferase
MKALVKGFCMTNQQDRRTLRLTEGVAAHAGAIAGLIRAAFGGEDEARLVEALRAEGAVVAELAALEDEQAVGHVLFSAVRAEPATLAVAALAPLAVVPERQRAGIGGALIRAGLELCRERGVEAVAVLGDPAYYTRFGFALETARPLSSVYQGAHFMALELRPGVLAGGNWKLAYPRAFEGV